MFWNLNRVLAACSVGSSQDEICQFVQNHITDRCDSHEKTEHRQVQQQQHSRFFICILRLEVVTFNCLTERLRITALAITCIRGRTFSHPDRRMPISGYLSGGCLALRHDCSGLTRRPVDLLGREVAADLRN